MRQRKESIKKIEEKIGSIWLLVTGIIIVTIGLIFAGMWSWSRIGNEGKIMGIFLFGIAVGIAGEYLYRKDRMIPFANGMTVLAFISMYAGCAVMYHYDYNFPLIITVASFIILVNIAASYRYQMYLLIGMSILASYLLVTIMRIKKIDGEPFISAPHYAMLLVGIAALFTVASYLVFDRTRSSKMAYITVIVTNIWLLVFNDQMTSEIMIAGALVMLLTAFLATGTSKMGLKGQEHIGKTKSATASKVVKKITPKEYLKLQEGRRKHNYFQFLWYGSLFLSMLVCIMVSLRDIEPMYVGSYELPWGGILFGATLITYAGSAVYLKDEVVRPWMYSIMTFTTGILIGVSIDTFWPIAISFVLANALLLNWRPARYLWCTCFVLSSVLCVLVSVEDTGLIALGSYELPRSTLLFGTVLLVFGGFTISLKKEVNRPYLFSIIAFAACIPIGLFLETFYPFAIMYLLIHLLILRSRRYHYSEVFYPLAALLIWFSYSNHDDGHLFYGLLGWGLLCLMIPLFGRIVFKEGPSNKRERIVFLATLAISAVVMAVITPSISHAAAQVSLLSLLICALWINYQAMKMLRIDKKEISPQFLHLERTARIKQNILLFLSASFLGLFLAVYTFKGYLDLWEYMPLIDLAVIFVALLAYPTVKKHASFSVIIPSTAVLVSLYVHYFDHSAENGIMSVILIGTLAWIYVLLHRFIIKPVSSSRKIFRTEFTASWVAFPIFLLIILCIDPFERVDPYLFWALVLASGTSAVVMRRNVFERSFGLVLLAVLLMAAGFVASFGDGETILNISNIRSFFLPTVVTLISLAYIVSMRIKSTTDLHIGKKVTRTISSEDPDPYEEKKENATIIFWLFFALIISCFACSSLGDFQADTTGTVEPYWIFIFFSSNWLLLLAAQHTLKCRNWHIILPLLALWPLGLGIDDRGTTASYLCISFLFVLLSQLYFYRQYKDPGNAGKISRRRSAELDDGFYTPLRGTMHTSMLSIAVVGLGILMGITTLVGRSWGRSPNEDFFIRYGFGILHFLMTFIIIIKAHRYLKRSYMLRRKPKAIEEDRYLFEQKRISRQTVVAAFSILFFVLSLSIVSYRFEYHSMAASAMVLTSVLLLFHIYKERERFWGFMAWGIISALIIRLLTWADPMEVTITPTTYLSGVVSDVVLSASCLSIVYLVWTKDTVRIYSKLNRISPVLMVSLSLIFFITPGGKFGRYFVPLAILVTAFKRRDAWSYPLAMICFLLTFYLFTGNPSNPDDATGILTVFQRKVFLLIMMGAILTLVLGTHRRFGREPMTGQTAFGLSAGIFILAIVAFWGWKEGEYVWLISVIWGSLGLSLVFFGHTLKKSYLRWMGLSVMGFVILKIVAMDSSGLAMGYRVIVFLSVGVMVILVSFLYYKLLEKEKKELGNSAGTDRKT